MPRTRVRRIQAGFSLIELLITMIVLVIVMGAVFSQINQVQSKTKSESMKLDLTQESREFIDQFARDLHMSGYPISKLYQNSGGINDSHVAVGLVAASPTSLRFEGDVYGDGTVYSVVYNYVQTDAADPNCPCLRRSVVAKVTGNPVNGQDPVKYYTEVQNVIDPAGQAQGLFTYFQADGTAVDVGTGKDIIADAITIQLIDAVKVNLNTRSKQFDPQTGQPAIVSVATIAELEN